MDAIEMRARELLEKAENPARLSDYGYDQDDKIYLEGDVLELLIAALTPPEGFVLVPVEPTMEMLVAAKEADKEYQTRNGLTDIVSVGPYDHYIAMLAARPEVKP